MPQSRGVLWPVPPGKWEMQPCIPFRVPPCNRAVQASGAAHPMAVASERLQRVDRGVSTLLGSGHGGEQTDP